ncbi:MAG TPA: M48 family metalloprotease [Solirubrobacteraceae bacterium]|jgi:STE24 endopeptidase|nr:M48 family metalloprotease [Solirubrobacteraceae bacterium]
MVKRHHRLPLALAAAVVAAEAAVLLLRPRGGVIPPVEVPVQEYFSAAEISRAEDFRGPQTALFALRTAIEVGVLVLAVRRPPRWLAGARRPVLAGAAAGALLSLATNAAPLPVGAISRQRAIDVGLVTQSWAGWAGDLAKGWTISAAIAGAGGALAVVLLRRAGRRWWLPASAIVVAFGAVITYAGPVVLDPVFNRFEPLPPGQTRSDVLELARRAGVEVGEVYSMDASRRTTAANAYVTGLGRTKRVVLYDTLTENFTRDEVRLVVAHELAHVRYRDVPNGLLFLALVAPAGMFAVARLAERLGPASGPGAIAPLALSLAIVAPLVTTVSLQLSRRVEARADSYSLRLTGAPDPFIGFERRIALRNVADPDPPAWRTALFGTHPPTIERIGIAEAYRRGER